jgi:microcystin-dependent protein
MSDPFIGEIKLVPYNFAPRGWAFCQGQLLPIAQNTALFSLLGTMYGGNGQTNFGLPDLRGRVVVNPGQGPGLSNYDQGEQAGVESVTLTPQTMPAHSHAVQVSNVAATLAVASGNHLAVSTGTVGNIYGTAVGGAMPSNAVSSAGGTQPHLNSQPYVTLNYVIALQGIFPSRN